MTLMQPYFGRGYNVSTDNFFTSRDLACKLLEKRTSIVDRVRLNRREIPGSAKLKLHESTFYESGPVTLVKYQAKPSKTVLVLSTQHAGAVCQSDGKKKPESVLYYNTNNCGVDMLDAMCRLMSTTAACRRWPLVVVFNILDVAGINAWIIYRKVTGSSMSRRDLLHQLSGELVRAATANSNKAVDLTQVLESRVNCQVKAQCNRNRTVAVCECCDRPVCGKCLAKVCAICK